MFLVGVLYLCLIRDILLILGSEIRSGFRADSVFTQWFNFRYFANWVILKK